MMEEEYRQQKAQGDINQVTGSSPKMEEHPEGDAGQAGMPEDDGANGVTYSEGTTLASLASAEDDDASIRGMVSPHSHRSVSTADGGAGSLDASNSIPIIRISTESGRGIDDEPPSTGGNRVNGDAKPNGNGVKAVGALEKPVQAAAGEGEQEGVDASANAGQEPFSFSNKRLCERWLDNLFMVLYEVIHPTFNCSSII